MPGQVLLRLAPDSNEEFTLGPGLSVFSDGREVRVVKPGVLHFRRPNTLWVNCAQKRYSAVTGEAVLGVVAKKAGDIFMVDIGASELAALSYEGFEGATKRNRPDVRPGDIVYALVSLGERDFEPELVCVRQTTGKAAGMGVIGREDGGGVMLSCGLAFARRLRSSAEFPLLRRLGEIAPFEVIVGANGRVWVHGRSCREAIVLGNAILSAEEMDNEQCRDLCRQLAENMTLLSG